MKGRSLLVLALVPPLMSWSAVAAWAQRYEVNLVQNPGCEDALVGGQPPGWTQVSGAWTRRTSDPAPAEGSAYFYAQSGDVAELFQDVDIHDLACASDGFFFEAAIRVRAEIPTPDAGRVVFEFRSATGEVQGSIDSGELSPSDHWSYIQHYTCCSEPFCDTQVVRVRLIGTQHSALGNDACFDRIVVKALTPLPVRTGTWGSVKALHR